MIERTGGNPFYLEELCRTLTEEGALRIAEGSASLSRPIEEIELPASVQAAIGSRLQRLAAAEREALRIASVIGPEFREVLLQEVWEDRSELQGCLARLREAALIRRVRIGANAAYRFSHAMIHQVVYGGLLRHQRKTLHQAVGQAIERLYPHDVERHGRRLAQHFREARDWDKAFRYGCLAVNRSWRMSRFVEANAELDLVEEAARKLPEARRGDALVETLFQQERLCEALAKRERQGDIVAELLSVLEPQGDSLQLAEGRIREGDLVSPEGQV